MPTDYQMKFGGTDPETKSLRGVRTWRLERTVSDFVLVGLRGQPWSPGENTARCLRQRLTVIDGIPTILEPHWEIGHPECECGFYAFHNPRLSDLTFKGDLLVCGVIQGYGRTTIGSLGFRSAKAKILAMFPFELNTPVHVNRYYGNFKLGHVDLIPMERGDGPLNYLIRRFPDVAVFRDYETMVSEFPTTTAGRFE